MPARSTALASSMKACAARSAIPRTGRPTRVWSSSPCIPEQDRQRCEMAENTTPGATRQRRAVSFIGLLFALIFFAVASVGFTGNPWWLLNEATKWVAAGIVAVVGVGLLLTALPSRQKKNLP